MDLDLATIRVTKLPRLAVGEHAALGGNNDAGYAVKREAIGTLGEEDGLLQKRLGGRDTQVKECGEENPQKSQNGLRWSQDGNHSSALISLPQIQCVHGCFFFFFFDGLEGETGVVGSFPKK